MEEHSTFFAVLHSCWAKADRNNVGLFHPILYHFADVAYVAGLLWKECLGDTIRAVIESDIGTCDQMSAAVVAFLAGLHDLGKVSPAFQRLRPDLGAALQEAGLDIGRGESKSHGIITARELQMVILSDKAPVHSYPITARILAQIAGAHHGAFAQAYDIQHLGPESLGNDKWTFLRAELVRQLWLLLNDDNRASTELGSQELMDPATVPLLAGLISVADWIGSNTDYFPFDLQTDPTIYFQRSAQSAHVALTRIGWLPAPVYAAPLPFEKVFPFPPNQMQGTVAELIAGLSGPFLLAVEAQMGQGKTEAALYVADYQLCRGGSRGLYIALPTQATSNAMFARVRDDYLKDRGHSGIEENMQLVHGNALLGDLMRVSGIGDETGNEDEAVSAGSWFTARKRPLLAPFGVGTIDQALLGVLQTRHWFVRLFGLANKVVIFDEVHAYDTYTSTLLDHLIKWLSALRCTVILLSATLPKKRLSELVEAYGGTQLAELADYPRVTLANRGGQPSCVSIMDESEPRPVSLEFESDDPFRVAQLVSKRLSDGGCAAVICNTVDRAQYVFEALQGKMHECDLILFHARTPFAWRKDTEEEVLRKFGKPDKKKGSPDRPSKAVVVATQVIEQSLDLDFDWILTDMAPVDLILQRLGREHRHKRPPRPSAVSSPVLTILSDGEVGGPPPEFRNAGIYERYTMLRSWLAITRQRSTITLPGDIDLLVQWVYGDEEPKDIAPEWREALETSREDSLYSRTEDAKKAGKLLVPKPGFPEDIIAQFNKQLGEDDDPAMHKSVKAATRDGDPSISVACLRRDGDKLYPMCGATQVDLASEPDKLLTAELLGSSLSIQKKGLYHALNQQDTLPGWRKSPHLRYHRVLEFVDGLAEVGSYRLRLSRELGLVIGKEKS